MKALNLYTLTRVRETEDFSRLAQSLCGRTWHKTFSPHEAASLCALVDTLTEFFMKNAETAEAGTALKTASADWISFFDGFWFSYTIEHISKEFDLLKLSENRECVLNIELKSEAIEEDRIRRQLEQNRYYLSHTARTILSYTYVMEEDTFYCLNDHGYLKKCPGEELAQAMCRTTLQEFVKEDIGRFFRAQDYLISPVKTPEKFLEGRYFLTNQQAEFRRQILGIVEAFSGFPRERKEISDFKAGRNVLEKKTLVHGESRELQGTDFFGNPAIPGRIGGMDISGMGISGMEISGMEISGMEISGMEMELKEKAPVISLTGNAGTGKTLLMFDLAMELSRRRKVLFLHGGPLREGHRTIDRRLHKVRIMSGTESGKDILKNQLKAEKERPGISYLLVDEANRFSSSVLEELLARAAACGIPCVFSYDPHSILGPIPAMEDAEAVISRFETLRLELSGNIRINGPIFSFLRTLFYQKDRTGYADYSCIDVLYAASRREARLLADHYMKSGYERLDVSPGSFRSGKIISQEFDRVLMILDDRFYYDDSLHLCADGSKGAAVPPLYEGLSRAREKLCLIIAGNPKLFSQILAIRTENADTDRS